MQRQSYTHCDGIHLFDLIRKNKLLDFYGAKRSSRCGWYLDDTNTDCVESSSVYIFHFELPKLYTHICTVRKRNTRISALVFFFFQIIYLTTRSEKLNDAFLYFSHYNSTTNIQFFHIYIYIHITTFTTLQWYKRRNECNELYSAHKLMLFTVRHEQMAENYCFSSPNSDLF